MSSFNCNFCNKEIIDTPGGPYITGCEHYPLEANNAKNLNDLFFNSALDNLKKMAYPPTTIEELKTDGLIEGGEDKLDNQLCVLGQVINMGNKPFFPWIIDDVKDLLQQQAKQSYSQGREDGIKEFLKYCKEHYWDSVTPQEDMVFYHLEQIQNKLLNQKQDE